MVEPLPFSARLFSRTAARYAKNFGVADRKFYLFSRTWGQEYAAYVAGLASGDTHALMLHEMYAVECMKDKVGHG